MINRLKLIALFMVIIAQLVVPAYIIIGQEKVISGGMEFKFKCAPIDPYDPFSGRYVAVNVINPFVEVDSKIRMKGSELVYVTIAAGKDGFAYFHSISKEKPTSINYIKTHVIYTEDNPNVKFNKIYFEVPFNRYYMDENKALETEKIIQKKASEEKANVYITIKVKNGISVVQNLYLDQKKIEEEL